MKFLEYPKTLRKDGEEPVTVQDAEQEAAAVARGYIAPPAIDPIVVELGGVQHLEYPKLLYRGEDEPVRVEDADQEAARRAHGYLGAGEAVAEPEDTPRRGRPRQYK